MWLNRIIPCQIEQILILPGQFFNQLALLNNHLIKFIEHFFMVGQRHLNRHQPFVILLHIRNFLLVQTERYVIINFRFYNRKSNAPPN